MRKVLSFVLVLSLVLGSFSMAFAATPAGLSDIDGNANEQAIEVAYNLGIVTGNPDGTFMPAKAVTRAEFAAMITRALNIPDSALAGYSSTSFKDTAGYGWAVSYLAFCQSKGIMLGDGAGNVMPGRTINTNEAVTMALRAIGYTNNSAKLVGVWPANYVTLAQTEGLYDEVAATTSVDKANAAQIIYNLLTVGLVQVNSDGETVALGKSVTNNGVTNFVATTLLTANHGAVANDEVVEYEDDAMINTIKYVGDYATVYRDKTDDNILAIGDIKSTVLDGEITELGTNATTLGAVGTIKVEADDVTYTAGDYTYYPYNQFDNSDPDQNFTLNEGDEYVFNVKLQGKRIVEIYSIELWAVDESDMAAAGDLSDIEDGKLLGFDFATDKNDDIIADSFELIGVKSLSDIKKDDVVYVYQDATDKEIRRVAVGTDIVEGKVTKISGTKYTVSGTEYKFSDEAAADRPDTGDSVKLYLDAYGKIFKFESTDGKADTYGVVISTGSGVDGNRVRLYDAVADDETVFSYTSDATGLTGIAANTLIGYALNKNGKVDDVELATVSAAAMKLNSAKVLSAGALTYPVKSDCTVITFDGSDFGVSTIGKIQTDVNLTQTAIAAQAILDDDGIVVALVVDNVNTGKNADDVYGVINSVDRIFDDKQDDTVQNIVGFAAGAALDKNTNDVLTIAPVNYATTAALFKIVYDADGYIKSITSEAADAAADGVTIAAVANSNYSVQLSTNTGVWAQIADNAVVYRITDYGDADDQAYSVSSVSGFKAPTSSTTYKIWLYETDDDSEGFDVVIYTKM